MNQQELEARLAAIAPNGDTRRLEFSQSTIQRKVTKPGADRTLPSTEETVSVPVLVWIDRASGRTLRVIDKGDSTYDIDFDGTEPKNQGDAASAEAGSAKPRQSRVNPADPTKTQEFDPDADGGRGAWVDAGANAAGVQAAADRNKPGAPTLKPDGKGGTIAVQTMPDGTIKTTPLPGVPSDASQITVGGVVYERGPDGYHPAPGIPVAGAGSKNVDSFTPDYGQPDLGFGAWAQAQRVKIGLPAEQGGITQTEYDSAVKQGHDQATVTIQNVATNQGVVRQRDIDEQGQRRTLSEQGAADHAAGQAELNSYLLKTKPGSRAIMGVVPGVMAELAKAREAREGTAKPMAPLHPMFSTLPAQAGVTTLPPGAKPSVPPAPAPADPAGAAAVQGAAIGANAAPPPAPIVSAPALAAPAQPVTNMPVTTQLPPQAQGPNPAINPATGEPTGLPPMSEFGQPGDPGYGSPVYDPNLPDMRGAGPQPGPTPPPTPPLPPGEITMAPNRGPLDAMARQALGPQPMPAGQAAPMNPAIASVAAPPPVFDPFQTAGRMATWGVPQDAIVAAMRELGLLPEAVA